MSNTPVYACTRCGKKPGVDEMDQRNNLTVKKVVFATMGAASQILQSRVVEWLCSDCLLDDTDYNREPLRPRRLVV